MDERFPRYLRWTVRTLSFLSVPRLGFILAALTAMAYAAHMLMGTPLDRFAFDPTLVMEGEWWRLFAFPLTGNTDNPIWLLFYIGYLYSVVETLESSWGTAPLSVFVLLSYLCAVAAAFLAWRPLSIWFYVMENLGLALGTLVPDMEFYFFLLLPVKAKWLAWFAGLIFLYQFAVGSLMTKEFLAIVLLPYLLFFSPLLWKSIQTRRKIRKNRKPWDSGMWR